MVKPPHRLSRHPSALARALPCVWIDVVLGRLASDADDPDDWYLALAALLAERAPA